jgi:protein TonB
MVKNSFLFFISGFVSLLLFFSLLSIVIYMAFINMKKPTFALKKDNYVSVSINFVQSTPKKNKVVVKKEIEEQPITPEVESTPQKKIQIDDLFSSVWTKDIKKIEKKKEQKNKRRLLDIEKKIKTLKKSQKSTLSKVVDTIDSNESLKPKKISTGDEVNEYLAKINAIVYNHFNPPANSEGNSVKARIDLSAMGKVLDFRILNYSSNTYLNEECDKIKARLKGVIFPLNPDNKRSVTLVILTSKE